MKSKSASSLGLFEVLLGKVDAPSPSPPPPPFTPFTSSPRFPLHPLPQWSFDDRLLGGETLSILTPQEFVRVSVQNLPIGFKSQDLRELSQQFGELVDFNLHVGAGRPWGHVQ